MELSWRLQRLMRSGLRGYSDEELFAMAYRNDEAFEFLMSKYNSYLMKLCTYLTSHVEDAEDLYQESVWKLYMLAKKKKKVDNFRPWVRKVVTNIFIDRYRKKEKKNVSLTDLEEKGYEVVDETFENSFADGEGFRELLSHLSPEDRVIITLRYADGLSYAEISRELGITEANARQRVNRIRKRLLSRLSRGEHDG